LGALRRLTVPARLCLAGVFTPADEEQIFRKHVKGLEKYVEMAGWLQYDQLAEFLLSADVGLVLLQPLPRYVAAVPVKLFEYMGSGLPVIANNFPAIIDIVNGANCGALVSPNTSPDDIASIIQDWWEHPDVPRNLGLNGRNAVLQQFHWEKDIDQLIQLYYSLTSR
jgi:glycosyltransferase involved in cell wall biosynthesis